jgi:hypothetical protein
MIGNPTLTNGPKAQTEKYQEGDAKQRRGRRFVGASNRHRVAHHQCGRPDNAAEG